MKSQRKKVLKWLGPVLSLVVILWGISSAQAQAIGKTIDKSNYQEYKGLLNPAMFRGVERGDWILPTGNLDFLYRHSKRFLDASERNAGKYDVNESGDLIEKSTGEIPKYTIYGYPFPKIDTKDPKVADKIIWNYNFQKYRFQGLTNYASSIWISKEGEERSLGGMENLLFAQGRPPGQELKNPENLLIAELSTVQWPISMKWSTMSLDYFDERDITVFSYIPAIRRVRQSSGVSRSDPYMGSNGWLDLNMMWAGKNRSMKWKLVGEKTILVPFTKMTKDIVEEYPDGTIVRKIAPVKFGFQTPGWKGAPWATTSVTYVPRQVWIIEQMPKNPNYNWGLHTNYVDKETSVIWYKEVCGRDDQFRIWKPIFVHYSETKSGNTTAGDYDASVNIDERIRHATTVTRDPNRVALGFCHESKLGLNFYTIAKLIELSK